MLLKIYDAKKIVLKELNVSMVSAKYLQWMNSKNLMRYTEQRFEKHSITKIIDFVKSKKQSKNDYLYGIFIIINKQKIHVGNIKLGPINFTHKYADISYFIGDIKFQKMGIGSMAIKMVLEIAKNKFKLKKIFASIYSNNIGSKKVLINNKFVLEGVFKKKFIYKNKRISELAYSKNI